MTGEIVKATIELYTAPLDEHGRLRMAEGVPMPGRAIDKGVFETVQPVHQAAVKAGNAVQVTQRLGL